MIITFGNADRLQPKDYDGKRKEFYGCMKDYGKISETDYIILCDDIKESMFC